VSGGIIVAIVRLKRSKSLDRFISNKEGSGLANKKCKKKSKSEGWHDVFVIRFLLELVCEQSSMSCDFVVEGVDGFGDD
jgi:hypothetical protein